MFVFLSNNFAAYAVKAGLQALSDDITDGLYIDVSGVVRLDDSQAELKWGIDALFANIGYRLIQDETETAVIRSVSPDVTGALIDSIPHAMPDGYSLIDDKVHFFRSKINLANDTYLFDVMRTDQLGKLANEAIVPALVDFSIFAITIFMLVFLIVSIVAARIVVNSVEELSRQVSAIHPSDLSARVLTNKLPKEFLPIGIEFNRSLGRVEEAFERQQYFFSNSAHELRTPLAIQLSRMQLMLSESDIKDKLVDDTLHMSRIVEQMLDLSRAEGMVEPELSMVDLVSTSKDVVARLAPLAISYDQRIELNHRASKVSVLADEGALSTVLKNLVENAIKHSPRKSYILITVGDRFVAIDDSGLGIAPDSMDNIFERFWRANQSDRSGSGLGLSIVKQLVSRFNAHINVEKSDVLGGARFVVEFNDIARK